MSHNITAYIVRKDGERKQIANLFFTASDGAAKDAYMALDAMSHHGHGSGDGGEELYDYDRLSKCAGRFLEIPDADWFIGEVIDDLLLHSKHPIVITFK